MLYYVGTAPATQGRPDYPSDFAPPLQVPRAPVVSGPQDTSLLLTIPLDGNPLTAQYALWCENLGKWVRADGSLGDTPVWRTAATWGSRDGDRSSPQRHALIQRARTPRGQQRRDDQRPAGVARHHARRRQPVQRGLISITGEKEGIHGSLVPAHRRHCLCSSSPCRARCGAP